MKKICPYCHEGKLTMKNTYNHDELLGRYSYYYRGFIDFRPHLEKNHAVIYRRYFCDKCREYVWSYEEFIHKVNARNRELKPVLPEVDTTASYKEVDDKVEVYKDGRYVGSMDANDYKSITELRGGFKPIPEDILNELRKLE